jgi:hypothetical protein
MYLAASFFVFVLYFSNVVLGAFWNAAVLGDVGEMVVLFVASVLFVAGILKKEADRKNAAADKNPTRE